MGRALVLQYRLSVGTQALRAWRGVARHQVQAKAKVMGMLYKTSKQVGLEFEFRGFFITWQCIFPSEPFLYKGMSLSSS